MKYFSEKTNKVYESIEALEKAETEFKAKKAEENKKQKERKTRAKEVDDAYQAIIKAKEKYNKLVDAFVKDYGSYHYSVTSSTPRMLSLSDSLFDDLFNIFLR